MRRHAHAGRIENIRLGVPAEIDEPAGHALLRETFDRGDRGGHVPGFAAIAGFDDVLFAGEDDVLFICAENGPHPDSTLAPWRFQVLPWSVLTSSASFPTQ